MSDKEAVTTREAARVLGCSQKSVLRLIRAKRLPAFRMLGVYRIKAVDLVEYTKRNKV